MVGKVYLVGDEGRTSELDRVRCKSESSELQDLLERNPHLLPSDQIYPDNPPQWLLVKREMPVIDPGTGSERWSIDFLFVDHMAIPTLVECKRCDDTGSRRKVIAQMLEYAANGHQYWSSEELQAYAQEAAGGLEELSTWVSENCSEGIGVGDFFETVVSNLRKATMRLVFFLEESPNELRSLVEFLNAQLKETEVLLVEARLFQSDSGRVVVPWLLGYTEQARVAKRESRVQASRIAPQRGESAFFQALSGANLSEEIKECISSFLNAWPRESNAGPYWVFSVNAILMLPALLKSRGILHVGRNGDLQAYFGYWSADRYKDITETQSEAKNRFANELQRLTGTTFSEKQLQNFPTVKAEQWSGKAAEIAELINAISAKHA